MVSGGCNVVVPRFDPELMAATIRAERVTHTFLVPTIIHRLLEAGPDVLDWVRELRQITFGGSPISPQLFRSAVEAFGPILTEIYRVVRDAPPGHGAATRGLCRTRRQDA